MILGVIADDFTGASDVASMLVRAGLSTIQVIGVPDAPPPAADAVVIALKSRTCPREQAVQDSLAALDWLRSGGARQIYFKYCSTFDSTAQGNIGPVAEALMHALEADFTIACPAFPENGRTVFRGHLFVGDQLLSDSGMRHHPLTPMTDANLVNVLQTQVQGRVGLARYDIVARGSDALSARLSALRQDGYRFAVVDAINNNDLHTIAASCAQFPLVTAGSGVALGLPAMYAARDWVELNARADILPKVGGRAAVLSGSCSQASNGQVRHWINAGRPALRLDPHELAAGQALAEHAIGWILHQNEPALVYATAQPEEVSAIQNELGIEHAGELIEQCLAKIACGLVENDVRRLVVAGGETSGAVVQALGIGQLRVGAQIDPGVPWMLVEQRSLLLALKSGNFGTMDFFSKALQQVA